MHLSSPVFNFTGIVSSGFGIGYLTTVIQIASNVVKACNDGPNEYRRIYEDAQILKEALVAFRSDSEDPSSLLCQKG